MRGKVFVALVSAAVCVTPPQGVSQQVDAKFSHLYHIEEEELSCGDCHSLARTSDLSNDDLYPRSTDCVECHDKGTVLMEWPAREREYRFSHSYHLETLGLECAACHGSAEQLDQPPPAALAFMAECMTCHNGLSAERECASCHALDRAELVPDSHRPGWEREHGQLARITDSSCLPCHGVSECQECHDGAQLSELTALSFPRQIPFSPELEGSKGQTLRRVHSLNYRFLHSLEARGKSSQCITCHELDSGDFCADCHNPGDNPGIRPVWHGGADWGALAGGVGTGGGRHAELARRDMENCASCHDLQGEDPSCLLCHMDRSRGKGNDAKTHARSFAGDFGAGDFHDDDGAVCFTCHTFKGPAGGDGFCGYCHGRK